MKTTAVFKKVPFEQFNEDWIKIFPEDSEDTEYVKEVYDRIKRPERGTTGAACYDFFIPETILFTVGGEQVIPTGISCVNMEDDDVLLIFPRSGLGTKFRFILTNSTGIIDMDYSMTKNKGHIFVKMINEGEKEFEIESGKAFCQGMLIKFSTTADDVCNVERTCGFGSTDTR